MYALLPHIMYVHNSNVHALYFGIIYYPILVIEPKPKHRCFRCMKKASILTINWLCLFQTQPIIIKYMCGVGLLRMDALAPVSLRL